MISLKKYNLKGEEIGEYPLDEAFLDVSVSSQMIKDYIVALRANVRQWSANTKGRSEVSHSNKKPFKQKGTGNARQGSLASPQFRGGGIVFGPKPKFNQHIRINKKERQLSNRFLLVEKIKQSCLVIIEDEAVMQLKEPQTKLIALFLRNLKLVNRSILFVLEGSYEHADQQIKRSIKSNHYDAFKKSIRNLPKSTYLIARNINGYDLLSAHTLVFTESAFLELKEVLV